MVKREVNDFFIALRKGRCSLQRIWMKMIRKNKKFFVVSIDMVMTWDKRIHNFDFNFLEMSG